MTQSLNLNRFWRVGILGGGQLALMLADAAAKMGLSPLVLAESPDSPAARCFANSIYGTVQDPAALDELFSNVDFVAFENEFIDCERLEEASKKRNVPIFPHLEAVECLQDKLSQKVLLKNLKIPTSAFLPLDVIPEAELRKTLEDLLLEWQGSCVLKWARMGYDGKGVLILNAPTPEQVEQGLLFCREARNRGLSIYAERKIHFQQELALVSVRSIRGEWAFYPLVISVQRENRCYRVYGPATAFVDKSIEHEAQQAARKLSESLGLVGVFAMEFFLTTDSKGEPQLLVNEIAPRVHNTGHFSQNACATSQFENHWRALLGWPLGRVDSAPAFAMLNLLGPAGDSGPGGGLPVPGPRSHLHWYGKTDIRPGRKLGHLNAVSQQGDREEFRSLIEELEMSHDRWVSQFQWAETLKP